MVRPVERAEGGPQLDGFQPFMYDSGRAVAAEGRARIGRTLTAVSMEGLDYAARVNAQAEEARRRATIDAEELAAQRTLLEAEADHAEEMEKLAADTSLSVDDRRRMAAETLADRLGAKSFSMPEVQQAYSRGAQSLKAKASQEFRNKVTAIERTRSAAELNAAAEALERMAATDLELAILRMEDLFDREGALAGLDVAKVGEAKQALRERWTETEAIRAINQDPRSALQVLEGEGFAHLDPRSRVTLIDRAKADVARLENAAKAERAAAQATVARQLASIERIVDAGQVPKVEQISETRRAARAVGLEADLDAILAGQADEGRFASSSLAEQAAELQAMQARLDAEGASEADVRTLNRKARIFERTAAAVKADPLAAAEQRGVVGALTPLDVSDPQRLAEGLQGRRAQAETASAWAGRPVSVLTREESAALGGMLSEATIAEKQQLIAGIKQGLDDREFGALMAQLTPDAPMAAYAGRLGALEAQKAGTSGPLFTPGSASALVLEGDSLLNPSPAQRAQDGKAPAFPLPTERDRREAFNQHVGELFESAPEAFQTMRQATDAAYAAMSAREGDYSGEINVKRYRKAIDAVSGGVVDINGRRVLKPFTMTEDQFLDAIDGTTAGVIDALGGVEGYSAEEAAEAVREGEFVNYGEGYAVRDGGRLLQKRGGGVFVWRPAAVAISRWRRP